MYISHANTISWLDLNDIDSGLNMVIGGFQNPAGLQVVNGFLYVARYDAGDIRKINLNDYTDISLVTSQAVSPNRIRVIGDELYFSDTMGYRIRKTNIADNSIDSEVVCNTNFITQTGRAGGLDIKDNYIYWCSNGDFIGRFDLTNPNAEPEVYVTGIDNPVAMRFEEDIMYVIAYDDDKLVKIDTSQETLVVEDVILDLDAPAEIEMDENYFYISEDNRIRRFDRSTLESETILEKSISLFPNPVLNVINISGASSFLNYHIYDLNGRKVSTGQLQNNTIDVGFLSKGMYVIELKDENSKISSRQKFLKN
ncbi:MAG: T9SS type A sorting domain-containing protein [Bacteroidota bacterium]